LGCAAYHRTWTGRALRRAPIAAQPRLHDHSRACPYVGNRRESHHLSSHRRGDAREVAGTASGGAGAAGLEGCKTTFSTLWVKMNTYHFPCLLTIFSTERLKGFRVSLGLPGSEQRRDRLWPR